MRKKLIAFGFFFLILLAGINIVKIICKDNQAQSAFAMHARMEGEYKVGHGEWRPIAEGEHIPAGEGEVVLRGTLHMTFPDGEIVGPVGENAQVVLYFDHIGGSVSINGEGTYFIADATNTYIWNMNIALTTTVFVLSIMLYGFFLEAFTSVCLVNPLKKIGYGTVAVSGIFTGSLLLYAFVSNVKLYDVFAIWIILQTITSGVLVVIFFKGIRATLREKEMEAKLEKSKTAVMFSQIQPHFLYNSLGAIRELCRQDPEDARNALGTFITYLRGNMDSIQREHTIHFSKELNHISAYLQLEKLRFGEDLNVVYDVQETDFFIPSLTIQPLVENAVKHGVCGREDGGTITLHTHRQGDAVVVKILDNGVGFDVDNIEKLEHVGIKNVRNRLKYIVNGTLDIESKKDVGTTATITIHDRKD